MGVIGRDLTVGEASYVVERTAAAITRSCAAWSGPQAIAVAHVPARSSMPSPVPVRRALPEETPR